MLRTTRGFTLAALCALSAACFTHRKGPIANQPPTTVSVENQAFLDADIYVLSGSQRIRLGTSHGNRADNFKIPPHLIFGSTALRFEAHPIGGRRNPVSPQISVSPGDELELTITPSGTLLISK